MNTLKYSFGITLTIMRTLWRRLIGQKQVAHWNLETELIWATTRHTLLASHTFGLKWLKALSKNYQPKATFRNQVVVTEEANEVGRYLKVSPKHEDKITSSIIYFHGGGYITSSPHAMIEFISRLALGTQSVVYAPFYPTALEAQYPKAHASSAEIAEYIINADTDRPFYLGGDSAGAALALSVFNHLTPANHTRISGCLLISPWVEPTSTTGTIQTHGELDVADGRYLMACYQTYVGAQPIRSEYPISFDRHNLVKLPQTLITVGTHEMLLDQALRLERTLQTLGTETTLKQYDSMFHTFWNHFSKIQAADTLMDDIAKWKA